MRDTVSDVSSYSNDEYYETFRFDSTATTNTLTDLKSVLIKQNDNANRLFVERCKKVCYILTISIICIPIIFCDIYFANSNHICLRNKIEIFIINIADYLLASGIIESIILVSYSINTFYIDHNNFDDDNLLILFISFSKWLCIIFSIIWTIIGSVMFWKTNTCYGPIYNYIFASIIIKSSISILSLADAVKYKELTYTDRSTM